MVQDAKILLRLTVAEKEILDDVKHIGRTSLNQLLRAMLFPPTNPVIVDWLQGPQAALAGVPQPLAERLVAYQQHNPLRELIFQREIRPGIQALLDSLQSRLRHRIFYFHNRSAGYCQWGISCLDPTRQRLLKRLLSGSLKEDWARQILFRWYPEIAALAEISHFVHCELQMSAGEVGPTVPPLYHKDVSHDQQLAGPVQAEVEGASPEVGT